MLPRAYLLSLRDGAAVRPAWLEPRHDAWLRTVLEAFEGCEGRTAAEVDARGEEIAREAQPLGLPRATAAGVWHVLRRAARAKVDASVPPAVLRAEAFELGAATTLERALAELCARHHVDGARLRSWLYADVPAARVLCCAEPPSAPALRDAYNMALAQGMLGRCTRVAVTADENLRAVVRAAKLRGLLVSIDAEGPVLRASGPLALFRQTVKYARALAMFLPSLVSLPRWSLEGELSDAGPPRTLRIDAASPLPRTWALPQRADSALERALMKALSRLKSGWTFRREGIVLRAGRELFFPDFVLERDGARVVVEIVGFWTPEYLERKLGQLESVSGVPLVVCVDETLACDPSRLPNADVVRFRRRLDPNVLLAAAERALLRRRG